MNPIQREARVFLRAHVFLLFVVLIGFARSFYLRGLFIDRPLNLLLQTHGFVLTLWFGLTVVQARLAQKGRRDWHRKLAWVAGALVIGVVISGAWVNTALALDIQTAQDPENMFIWANYMSLLSFVALVAMAVVRRRQLVAHRRLILFASIAIIGPAFARFALWPWVKHGLVLAPVFAVAGMLLLVIAALVYDLARMRRVQAATWIGLVAIFLPLFAGTGVAITGLGFNLLHQHEAAIKPASYTQAPAAS